MTPRDRQPLSPPPHGPDHGLTGLELMLWRCWEATGADVSGGPCDGWYNRALEAVYQLRHDYDRLADTLDRIAEVDSEGAPIYSQAAMFQAAIEALS